MKECMKGIWKLKVPGLANVLLMSSDPDPSVFAHCYLEPWDLASPSVSWATLATANPLALAPSCSGSSGPAAPLVASPGLVAPRRTDWVGEDDPNLS